MATIRLSKQDKTIKIVHRTGSVSLKRQEANIKLQHTGKRGPEGPASVVPGPPGPTGVSTFVRVHHGDDPDVERPNALYVEWVGSVAPANATEEDTWVQTQ